MSKLVQFILSMLARLPLPWLQGLGAILGQIAYYSSSSYAKKIKANLQTSQICHDHSDLQRLVKQTACETGKGALELAIAWCRDPDYIASTVKSCSGWDHVETALNNNRGIVFVTPHLGSYDIAGRYISSRLPFPLTAMYRPPRLSWLEPIMQAGRARGKGKTAQANASGVRILMKALKSGEATIILPDQVPGQGEGVWAPFFGKPAYTMTLVSRLAQMSNVKTLLFVGERLPKGQGFHVHIEPLPSTPTGDKEYDTAQLNLAIENLIRRFPSQYLWSYNRYKTPRGITKPTQEENHS